MNTTPAIRKVGRHWRLVVLFLAVAMGTLYSPCRAAAQSDKAAEASAQAAGTGSMAASHKSSHGESEEAAESDEMVQFKQSASVRWIAKILGLSLSQAYWLSLLLNFAVIAGGLWWAGRKFLPGAFRARTVSIQTAMEEARKTSEEANRRLADIESRLGRLDTEIAGMRTSAEAETAAEEERNKTAAAEDARKILQQAEQEIEAAAKTARRELTAYAADLAVSLAENRIKVDPQTDQVLVRGFSRQLTGYGERQKDGR